MGITERVERMRVRVAAPSGSVFAEIDGRSDVSVSFAPGFYQRAGEHEMEGQLAQVARLLWAARMRDYNAIIIDEYQECLIIDPRPISARDVEFYERRDSLVAEGRSPDGRVYLSVRGMREWKVRIAPGTIRQTREDAFAGAVAAAARQLIADQRDKTRELKIDVYAPEFVADYKE